MAGADLPTFAAGLARLGRLVLKELREVLRDRRTILTLVLMPVLVYPLLSVAFQQFFLASGRGLHGQVFLLAFPSDEEAALAVGYLDVTGAQARQPPQRSLDDRDCQYQERPSREKIPRPGAGEKNVERGKRKWIDINIGMPICEPEPLNRAIETEYEEQILCGAVARAREKGERRDEKTQGGEEVIAGIVSPRPNEIAQERQRLPRDERHLEINRLPIAHDRIVHNLPHMRIRWKGRQWVFAVPLSIDGNHNITRLQRRWFSGHIHPDDVSTGILNLVIGPAVRRKVEIDEHHRRYQNKP